MSSELVCGKPTDAALGVNHYMKIDLRTFAMPTYAAGIEAIVSEFERHGSESDRECVDYVLRRRAGSSDIVYSNGHLKRDCDPSGRIFSSRLTPDGQGMAFQDFVSHERSRIAQLQEAHVLALRLYTTAAYRSLNSPLRDTRADRGPHPFPMTINYLREGICQLRAASAQLDTNGGTDVLDLWRGLKDLHAGDEFQRSGGTELAPMSTTTDLKVAIAYSISRSSLLLKLRTTSFMGRGANLSYLSAFPGEAEILFPPLTYLRPTGRKLEVTCHGVKFTVLEVEPTQ
jgi:hypothetical protein